MRKVEYNIELIATAYPAYSGADGHVTFGYGKRNGFPTVTIGIKEFDRRTESYKYATIEIPLSDFVEISDKYALLPDRG